MKISKFYFLAFAIGFVFVLTNCSKDNQPLPVQDNNVVLNDLKASGPSANGQGTILFGDDMRHFSFHARVMSNGDVIGNGVLTYMAIPAKIHFDIDCINIWADGKTAVMSGIITKAKHQPEWVNKNCWFKVIDNGEGSNADPDQMTLFYIDPDDVGLGDCNTNYTEDVFEISGGNIQVKP